MFDISPIAEELVSGWIPHFADADAAITWLDVEREHELWLDADTLLVGRIDALGLVEEYKWEFAKTNVWSPTVAAGTFFAEWKSQSPPPKYKAQEWKQTWRMNPQSLTYGVLVDSIYPGTRRFTVRKGFKSSPPTFDFEWFAYSDAEVEWWRGELLDIAAEIRWRRKKSVVPWAPNFDACFKYGPRYVCPFFGPACSQLNWTGRPVEAVAREPHLEVERTFLAANTGSFGNKIRKNVVVLDATRTETWINCRERYRRQYEEGTVRWPGRRSKSGPTCTIC